MERQTELENCNFVKTILMIMVILYHCMVFWRGDWFTKNPQIASIAIGKIATWLNTFHIYGFALTSGYIFYYLTSEKKQYQVFKQFLYGKIKRLIVPYIFISIIWIIPVQNYFLQLDWNAILNDFILGKGPNQLWFILMLFWTFIISYKLYKPLTKTVLQGGLIAMVLYMIGHIGPRFISNYYMIWTGFCCVPVFWLGMMLRKQGTLILKKISGYVYIFVDIILFLSWEYLSESDMVFWRLVGSGVSFVLHIYGAVMAFIVLQKIADKIHWKSDMFEFFQKRSMAIYLIHQQIIYFPIYLLNGKVAPYINVFVNFAVAMTVSCIFASFLLKYKITRFMIGEKI